MSLLFQVENRAFLKREDTAKHSPLLKNIRVKYLIPEERKEERIVTKLTTLTVKSGRRQTNSL